MSDINQDRWQKVTLECARKGLCCERVGPACFSILGNEKVITLATLEGEWYLETMGALGYKAPVDADVVNLCYECLHSLQFQMSVIPQELVAQYKLKQLSDAEFEAAQVNVEIDE